MLATASDTDGCSLLNSMKSQLSFCEDKKSVTKKLNITSMSLYDRDTNREIVWLFIQVIDGYVSDLLL